MDNDRTVFIENCLLLTIEALLQQQEITEYKLIGNEFKDSEQQFEDILKKSVALTEKIVILRDELIKKHGRKSTKTNRSRNSSRSQLLTESNGT
jgi:hypothetical protein